MIDPTAFKKSLKGKPVALFGLGKSGLATIKWLMDAEIETIVWDDRMRSHHDSIAAGANVRMFDDEIMAGCACLILAPGVPLTHPEPHWAVKLAHKHNVEIIGDIEVLHRCNHEHKTIAITGTNGKSTTTALLNHVLNECGNSAVMGGNIGVPVLSFEPSEKETIFVLEVSSYQIDLSPEFAADIGVLLNVTPDHIDRHGTFKNYRAVKERLVSRAKISVRGASPKRIQEELGSEEFPSLPGDHNKQNILAVIDICNILEIDKNEVLEAVRTFPGLAHRQYLVRTINKVSYVNDSKATNAEATSKALDSHDNIFWILGGQAKEGGLDGLEKFVDKIRHAYLIGEAAEEFEPWMEQNNIDYKVVETLDTAIPIAHKMAQNTSENATVLLSPACASWDQFPSFEARGEAFIKYVEALPE